MSEDTKNFEALFGERNLVISKNNIKIPVVNLPNGNGQCIQCVPSNYYYNICDIYLKSKGLKMNKINYLKFLLQVDVEIDKYIVKNCIMSDEEYMGNTDSTNEIVNFKENVVNLMIEINKLLEKRICRKCSKYPETTYKLEMKKQTSRTPQMYQSSDSKYFEYTQVVIEIKK